MRRHQALTIVFTLILGLFIGTSKAATYKTLYSFQGSDGSTPEGTLILDKQGNLYGTTVEGGAYGYGTVFELTPVGGGVWSEQVLHGFNNDGTDGVSPCAGLIFDEEGNLYGTTYYGGSGTCNGGQYPGCGTIFELSPNSGGTWTEELIHTFTAGTDGAFPAAPLVRDSQGNLYGTTASGGTGVGCDTGGYVGCGTAFALMREKNGKWKTVVYSFNGTNDGEFPYGSLHLAQSKAIYGTTEEGGALCPGGFSCGVVFEISRSQTGAVEAILHNFLGGTDGQWPVGPLSSDANGNLYGTTIEGGGNDLNCLYGCGTVYQLSPQSGSWSEHILYGFFGGSDGLFPFGGVIRDMAGNLYGTTYGGGVSGCGTVFELDSEGAETVLYNFTGGLDGGFPVVGLTPNGAGNLYGVTEMGGTSGYGVVFEITP